MGPANSGLPAGPSSTTIVTAALAPWKQGERAVFGQLFEAPAVNDLVLMDRGYPALWLFALLQARGVHFCARLDFGLWRATELLARHDASELCYVAPLSKNAQALCAAQGVIVREIKLQVLRVRLPNGQDEYLVTSLLDAERYPRHLFADLYARRWAVEEAIILMQRVLLANLTQLFALASDRRIRHEDEQRQRRHRHQTNRAWVLSQVRHFLPRLLVRPTLALIRNLLQRLASAPEAVRPGRSYPRTKSRTQPKFSFVYRPVA